MAASLLDRMHRISAAVRDSLAAQCHAINADMDMWPVSLPNLLTDAARIMVAAKTAVRRNMSAQATYRLKSVECAEGNRHEPI